MTIVKKLSLISRKLAVMFAAILVLYLCILIKPGIAFAYSYDHGNVRVASDRPIDPLIGLRIDESLALISKSELYDPDMKFRVYICNESWRMALFGRNPNVGGIVQGVVSENIFIRETDIANNRLIPPGGWMYDMENRPFTYFLAHEMTHALQARLDRFMMFKRPAYVMEGYADYIGKGKNFELNEAISALQQNHEFYAPDSPLYARQHLYIAYLMDVEGLSFKQILSDPPELEDVLRRLR